MLGYVLELTKAMTSATVLSLQTENDDCRQRWEISMSTGIGLDFLWSKTTQTHFTESICETSSRKTGGDNKIYSD